VEGFERSLFNGEPKARRRAPKLNLDQVKRDVARASAEQQQHMSQWREVFHFTMPNRSDFDQPTPGADKMGYVTDSAPIGDTRRGAGNLKDALLPSDAAWVEFEAGEEIPEESRDQANEIFEQVRDIAFDELANSNHDSEADSMAMDIMCSMGHMVIDPGTPEQPLLCRAIPLVQTFPVEGPGGEVESVYRKYEMPVGHVQRLWPTATLPREWADKLEKDRNSPVTLVEGNVYEPGHGYRFVVLTGDCKTVVHEVEPSDPLEPSRSITPRLMRLPGEVYGRGPLIDALPDIRVLNKREENSLRAQAKALTPGGLIAGESNLNPNTMRTGPNAWNVVSSASGLRPADMISAFPMTADIRTTEELQAQKRRQIARMLFAEPLLPDVEASHQMTAYEVQTRRLQQLAERGVDMGRVQREWAFATIKRVVWCLQQVGTLPSEIAPGVRLQLDNRLIRVKYSGPLAQSRDASTAANILQSVGDIRAAVGDETAATAMRLEDVPREIAELRNVPAKLLRSAADIQKLQEAKAQAAQQQMAAQQQQAEAGQGPAV
jgi:hypothetical protein